MLDSYRESEGRVLQPNSRLSAWIDGAELDVSQLTRWLQGYDLPPVGHAEEPYLWILYALGLVDERFQRETELAGTAAVLLDAMPDVRPQGKRPNQLLYNLLMLSAGLSCPDQLSEPLQRMLLRARLSGDWLGVDLREALRAALAENQVDDRLFGVWEGFLTNRPDAFLAGTPYDGFHGVSHIGFALTAIGAYLDEQPDRRPEFRRVIVEAMETYPLRPTWSLDLLQQANTHDWPRWQVTCLPSLFIPLASNANGSGKVAVWAEIYKNLAPSPNLEEPEERLCHGEVVIVSLSKLEFEGAAHLAKLIEPRRWSHPYASDRSLVGVVADSLGEAELAYQPIHSGAKAKLESIQLRYLKANSLISDGHAVPA
jgi:hypothetical protein